MVMEAPPSPQSVGREFVRQYYTLLNKAPNHLHRFYNHQSSFIHGGVDSNRETILVIGQKQIHQKIQQLNFRDCHAKITQVDSQATLGGGVVVQVTGELSNAGEPMRRFTQTFVLASQSPKKYYVHNDIFRYQDEIITDEECDGDIRSEVDEQIQQQPIVPAPGIPFYGGAPNAGTAVLPLTGQPLSAPPHILPTQPINQPQAQNGHPTEEIAILQQGHITQQPLAAPLTNLQSQPIQAQIIEEPAKQEIVDEPAPIIEDVAVVETEQEPVSNEPKTYANLLKASSINQSSVYQQQPSPYRPQSPPNNRPAVQTNGLGNRGPRVPPTRPAGGNNTRGPRTTTDETSDSDNRRRSQSSNFGQSESTNQLFLGNLPHTATEDELREIFAEFGAVLDLRVHSKASPSGPKGAQGGRTPNYGFITYESHQSVTACLSSRPIFYPKNDSNGTQMNVEEKKNKDRDSGRNSYGSGGPRSGMDNNRSGGRGDNQRRGMGPGGPRGGPGGQPQERTRTGDRDRDNNRFNRSGGGGGGGGPPNRGGPNNYARR